MLLNTKIKYLKKKIKIKKIYIYNKCGIIKELFII